MKQDNRENYLARLASARRNILLALHYGRLLPFHWSTKGYRCFYCDKPMKDCETLKEHTSKHQTVDLETFTQKIVTKDLPIKIDVSNIGCKVCGEDMQTIEDLTSHITSAHGEEYDLNAGVCLFPFILNKDIMKCVLCENSYDNFMCMMTHMHKEHMTHSCICQICGLSFADKMKLKRHISNSHNGHKCTVCEKVFDAFHKLERHKQRIHGHIKTYECNLCSGTFDSDYQVKVHMGKVHNVEKYRIKCEYCPKITTTKGAMMLHIQSMHSDVKYKCDICDYTAGVKWMIKLHKRKHFGNKDYSCSICDRRFGRSSNVRTHMKVHTGSFGRVCRWCRQGFTDLETLHIHEMEVHYYNQYN